MSSRVSVGLTWLLFVAASISGAHAVSVAPVNCTTSPTSRLPLPHAAAIEFDVHVDHDAWLEIDEAGAETDVSGIDRSSLRVVTVPPRYGRIFVPLHTSATVTLRRSTPAASEAAVQVSLHCAATEAERDRISWYVRAAALSAQLMPNPSGTPIEALQAQIDRLSAHVPDPSARALLTHLRAQTLYVNGRTSESVQAFAEAESEWRDSSDPSRALVARVGRVEDLIRAGRYEEAKRLTVPGFGVRTTDRYFVTRLSASRCLVSRYLGDFQRALQCYERVLKELQTEDERIEAASTMQDLASVLRFLGQRAEALRRSRRAIALAEGPYAPVVRGRSRLLIGDLQLDRGDIAAALVEFDGALAEFASIHASRWEANTMLLTASVYAELGALDESYALIHAARQHFSEKDAPGRIAAASMTLAKTDFRAHRFREASEAAMHAQSAYSGLAMTAELDGARLMIARSLLEHGDSAGAEQLVTSRGNQGELNRVEWRLIAARVAIQRGNPDSAHQALADLGSASLSLSAEIERSELEGSWLAATGERDAAQRILLDAAKRIVGLTNTVRSPLLREMLVQRIAPLRSLAIGMLLDDKSSKSSLEATTASLAWEWLQLTNRPSTAGTMPAGTASENTNRFDGLIVQELLGRTGFPNPAITAERARQLLSLFAAGDAHHSKSAATSVQKLETFQQHLADGSVFVAYFDAGKSGALLWVTDRTARLVIAPDSRNLQEMTARLIDATSKPATSIVAIHAAAKELSVQLLGASPMTTQPTRLLVEAEAELGAIPWPLMRWPGDSTDLIEHTVTSLVRPGAACCGARASQPRMHVFSGAHGNRVLGALPFLPAALIEARLVSSKFDAAQGTAIEPTNDRTAILDALRRPGDWVHIAGHGVTNASQIGYSGIWLDPAMNAGPPSFLSGIDVLESGVESEAVVLDACDLGERANDGIRPRLSFADGVSKAGAHHVVAALWPVSDAAAALWVDSFYRVEPPETRRDVAASLRNAQMRLRASRNFSHPFFWASWIHIEALPEMSPGKR